MEENYLHLKLMQRANLLVQQASGFDVREGYFHLQHLPMHEDLIALYSSLEKSAQPIRVIGHTISEHGPKD